MVQEYISPVRVHKYPFEMVMAVSICQLFVIILVISVRTLTQSIVVARSDSMY